MEIDTDKFQFPYKVVMIMYAAQTARKSRPTGDFIFSSHSNLGVAKGVAFSSDSKKCERLERIIKVRLWGMTMGTSQMHSCMEECIHELNVDMTVSCFG